MTQVAYAIHDDEVTIEITGHAGFAEKGQDIVCSAISILIQTLAAHLDNVADRYECTMNEGYAYIYATGYEAKIAAETIMAGFYLLAENYPDYVSI